MFERKSDIHESMPEMKWSTLRRWPTGAGFAMLGTLLVGAVGCVDPTEDLNDWLSRTADARSPQAVVEAGPTDAGPGDASFSNTYLMACLSSLNLDPSQPFLFNAVARYTPAATGGGTLDFTETTLVVGAQSITQIAPGAPTVTVNASTVAPDGTCDVHIGQTLIPGSADPLGPEVDFSDSDLHFQVSPDDLCANLSGTVVAPIATTLDPSMNHCVLRLPTSPLPRFQLADFHCP
jgi:hypothetical protein